jgi:lipid-A-disaccharide synthase
MNRTRWPYQQIVLCIILVYGGIIHGACKDTKVFMVTGEASGDHLGAWYARKVRQQSPVATIEAIGGDMLSKEGVPLYDSYNRLSLGFVGLGSFLYHIPERYRQHKKIVNYIIEHNFSHVVLVDCPLTNFMLARSLKRQKPEIHITYIAPPEMWIWGKWGMPWWLRSYCNKVVVIYPFEVAWYKENGLDVVWEGYPYLEELRIPVEISYEKQNSIALLPGSRKSELTMMLPIFVEVVKQLRTKYKDLHFIMPLAQSFCIEEVEQQLRHYGIQHEVELIADGDPSKYKRLARCCVAVTKPGTITLLLALLGVPSVIAYRVPWFTYLFARALIQVPYVGLPNLMLKKEIFPELLQSQCTPERITREVETLYTLGMLKSDYYRTIIKELHHVRTLLQN